MDIHENSHYENKSYLPWKWILVSDDVAGSQLIINNSGGGGSLQSLSDIITYDSFESSLNWVS